MKRYAQIDNDGIVRGVSELSGSVTADNLIEISSYDESLLGKQWTGTEFAPVPTTPQPKTLSSNQLIALVVSIIGEAAFFAAWDDPNLRLWRLRIEIAKDLERDNPETAQAFDGVVSAGHMTAEQKDQIMAAWPVG